MTRLTVRPESWPIRGRFTISRGSRTSAEVVVVELETHGVLGRGECVPYARYGESVESVVAQIEALRSEIEGGLDRETLQQRLPAGAARNAVDCALWDVAAKRASKRVWQLLDLPTPEPVATCYTLSLDTATRMAVAARAHSDRPVLKLKLEGPDDLARVSAVRENAPRSRLVVDANEAWTAEQYTALAPELKDLGVELIEQPLPAGDDEALAGMSRPVPVAADESCHTSADLPDLAGKYDLVNVKLDKTGGLTEALKLKTQAVGQGFGLMVGCMVGTSLAMAPAVVLAQDAEIVDLDGPLLLAQDRDPGLTIDGSLLHPPPSALWG
ncbi:L-alanine-DL-glutamate epimerase [Limimonas halophila]|uniref:Dipeptide epimerase n=1 Tax=Limimonas halophila TaxID=1082479 RepID=A0A1G7RW75_9PROT|nr:N-acetyl-D-Glu racemase DgcA [Limimonas halophila]SDG14991.1 L-alanine-DL-glutamate epimerase [Limimonas halophila]